MLCPAPSCREIPLDEKEESAGLLLDFCPQCGGAWLDPGELERLGAGVEGFERLLAETGKSLEPTKHACPKCSSAMDRGWIEQAEVEVLVCSKCKGSWMDSTALHKLRAFIAQRLARQAPPPPAKAPLFGFPAKAVLACLGMLALWKSLPTPPPRHAYVPPPAPAEPAPIREIVRTEGPNEEALQAMVKAAVDKALKPARKAGTDDFSSEVDEPNYSIAADPSRVALVVGVEKYPGIPAADYALHDAVTVRDHLLAMGFPARNVLLLTDAEATKGKLSAALNAWLPKKVDEKSTVFFYYSGHGAPDPVTSQAYLLPVDGEAEDLTDTALPLKQVYHQLNSLKARHVVIALDSCFSGLGGRSVLAKGTRPLVTRVAPSGGRMDKITVLSASGPEQISGAIPEEGHGAFTYFLLKGLNGGAVDAQGRVTVSSLFGYLRPQVEDAARLKKREQTPQLVKGTSAGLVLR